MYKSRRSGHTSSRRADLSTSAPHALVDFKPADDTANAQPELTAKPNGAHIRKSSSGAVLERRKESVANGLATRGTSHAQNGPNQRPVVATHPDWLVEEPFVDVQTPTLVVHQACSSSSFPAPDLRLHAYILLLRACTKCTTTTSRMSIL